MQRNLDRASGYLKFELTAWVPSECIETVDEALELVLRLVAALWRVFESKPLS
jgi:hypothetical protein